MKKSPACGTSVGLGAGSSAESRTGMVLTADPQLFATIESCFAPALAVTFMRPPADAEAALRCPFLLFDEASRADLETLVALWKQREDGVRPTSILLTRIAEDIAGDAAAEFDVVIPLAAGVPLVRRVVESAMEHRALQNDLDELGRFAALGKVLAGALHELKNPLGNVLGAMDQLEPLLVNDARAAPWMRIVRRNGELLRESLADLLDGFREGALRKPIPLHPVLGRAIMYAVGGDLNFRRRISLIKAWADPPPGVVGNSGQLLHLFLNLLVNARQAIGEGVGGVLEIETTWENDAQIAVEVRDSGPGIAPEALPELFRARRSTKLRGSGFGLSFCHQIASEHGGEISACNREGAGACFRVVLPATPV